MQLEGLSSRRGPCRYLAQPEAAPERRKVWLACDEHRQPLADFVGIRGFLIEVLPVASLTDADG